MTVGAAGLCLVWPGAGCLIWTGVLGAAGRMGWARYVAALVCGCGTLSPTP